MADIAPAQDLALDKKSLSEHSFKEEKQFHGDSTKVEALEAQLEKRDGHDGIIDGIDYNVPPEEELDLEIPTEEDRKTLRRVADKLPLAGFSVAIVELCERFAFYGLSGPFQNYLANKMPVGGNSAGAPRPGSGNPAGALGQKQSAATGLNNMFSFLAYIFPIFGGILADTKWGRLKTIAVACVVYEVGLLIVTFTSVPSSLARGGGLPGWIVGAIIVAMGTGGIKSNVSPLIADQYRVTRLYVKTLPSGERVIVDPNLTIQRIYNIFYWCINVGSLASIATSETELHKGFWVAYLLPTVVFLVTPVVLFVSRKHYYVVPPRGSVVVETWRVFRIATRGFWLHPMKYMRDARVTGVWNRAKPSHIAGHLITDKVELEKVQASDPRITWDDAFVEETKRTLKACQIFIFYPLWWIAYNQLTTNLISQAATMTLHGLPNDLVQNFDAVTLIIFIPIMDIIIYPALRRVGIVLRPIKRIYLGFLLGGLSMVYSAVLQHFIYRTNACGNFVSTCDTPSTLSVWIQLPAYILIALSEIFASITGLEYAYNKAPKRMKSVVTSIYLFQVAIANAINAALAPVAEDPKLVGNYSGVAITNFIAGTVFYLLFRHRDRIEEDENAIGKGKRELQESDSTLNEPRA